MDISSKELACPCHCNSDWKFLYNSGFGQYNLPIYECIQCKLQTIYPKPVINYQEMYGEGYYTKESNFNYKDERKTEKFDSYVWDARIRNIMKYKKSGNFLDVGSSFGGFLTRAKHFGFSSYGIEISKYSSEYSNQRGIPTFQGNFLDSNYPENYFDVITLIEVIEHLENPEKVFEKLSKLLKNDGLLIIQTANFEGTQARLAGKNYHYYLPGHLYYYSLSNLKKILTIKGFNKFIMYYGVDFPLSAKLLKSRGSFKTWTDYFKWFKISYYHLKSSLIKGSTSSMVLYSFK